ncbi:MAG: cation:proton antiporter [Candidatus Pacearchaeota archaeon]|nr:cation:proton antiporter [Candidatus Pacearchaeota archaeon]
MESIIIEIGVIIGLAAVLSLFGRAIKQPPIIAYLITGILVGPFALNLLSSTDLVQALARMGVTFLLFIVGLNLDFRVLKDVGGVALGVGLGQILVTASIGFLIAIGFGFSSIPALYIAAGLAFSSTVVAVKLLSDKKELDTLHGKIGIGVLIVQDFVAAIALMLVPVLGGGDISLIFIQLIKGAIAIAGVFLISYFILHKIVGLAARNQEILFLFSVAWTLIVAIAFEGLGFSIEIGALLAGMALASSKYNLEIKGKITGIRDFFVVLFFVFFGSKLIGPLSLGLITKAFAFSIFVLVGNPIIVMTLMKFFGYKKKVGFHTGILLAQISEFSLILILLGATMGVLKQEILSLSILVALITIALSSYMVYYSNPIYNKIKNLLNIFDGKKKELGTAAKNKDYDVILMGYGHLGFNLLKAFNKARKKYLVIDFNPDIINKLSKRGINCAYGDVNDSEFLNELRLRKAEIIISTISDLETNIKILREIKNKNVLFIPTSKRMEESIKLYEEGADYVIMPSFLGGDFMAHLLVKDNFEKKEIRKEGKKQLKEFGERISHGHHPRNE